MIKDVMVGFPCYDGRSETDTIQTLMLCLTDGASPVGSIQYLHGDSLVTRARNKIVKKFLDSKMDYLMFVDSDILFFSADITQLRQHDKDIVAGVYLKKKLPYSPVCNSKIGEDGDLDVVREAGTGFIMIHRRVFDAIRAKFPEHTYRNEGDEEVGEYYDYFRVGVKGGRYLSEDYYFCQIAGECDIKTHYDTSILVRHAGRAVYPFRDEELIDGATELINMWSPDIEIPRKNLSDLREAIDKKLGDTQTSHDIIRKIAREELDHYHTRSNNVTTT